MKQKDGKDNDKVTRTANSRVLLCSECKEGTARYLLETGESTFLLHAFETHHFAIGLENITAYEVLRCVVAKQSRVERNLPTLVTTYSCILPCVFFFFEVGVNRKHLRDVGPIAIKKWTAKLRKTTLRSRSSLPLTPRDHSRAQSRFDLRPTTCTSKHT